jgi:hypothetical protein
MLKQLNGNKQLISQMQTFYWKPSVISGFRHDVDKIGTILGCYAVSCGNYLPTFRYNALVPYSTFIRNFFHFDQCGTYGGEKPLHTEFRSGNLKKIEHLEGFAKDGSVVLKMDIKEITWKSMTWINLAQDTEQWRVVVSTLMSLLVP